MIDEIWNVEKFEEIDKNGKKILRGQINHHPSGQFYEWTCDPDGWDSMRDNAIRRMAFLTSKFTARRKSPAAA
jgi:hypothetical protein